MSEDRATSYGGCRLGWGVRLNTNALPLLHFHRIASVNREFRPLIFALWSCTIVGVALSDRSYLQDYTRASWDFILCNSSLKIFSSTEEFPVALHVQERDT